ncbi:MAG: hypothetical protein NDI61_00830 [Bdellovibrionaceae bacterium]|nr:hypothetical protein [Pseudobdellovibrionaceae bacterium]
MTQLNRARFVSTRFVLAMSAWALFGTVQVGTVQADAAPGRLARVHDHKGPDACDLVPPNRLQIADDGGTTRGGMNQVRFNQVLKAALTTYEPIFRNNGQKLILRGLWKSGDVNAHAYPGRDPIEVLERGGGSPELDLRFRRVDIYGGLARHPDMTADGLLMVICHEIGHHIGGMPAKFDSWGASNEGQSDYFAATKCMRKVLENVDNVAFLKRLPVDAGVRNRCTAAHSRNIKDSALCIRTSMAGLALAKVLSDLGAEGRVDFRTPDRSVVAQTDNAHPAAQCRLDTYFAGALCRVSHTKDMSFETPISGACVPERATNTAGARPNCWFNPKFYDRPELLTRL